MGEAPYEVVDGIAVARVTGRYGLQEGTRRVTAIIAHAKAHAVERLLVDVRAVGEGPPTVAERYSIMHEWAAAGRGVMCVAVVVRPEFIEPDHFGAIVAASRGLTLRGFATDDEAVAWLREQPGYGG